MSEDRRARVVVGASQSLAGLQALRYGVAEARRRGLPLHAVRAWRFEMSWRGAEVSRLRREIAREELQYAYGAFDAAMGGLPADLEVIVVAPEGRPDTVLTDLANDGQDLLVIGGRTGRWWPRWLVRACARRAACPVVLVPPPEIARAGRPVALRRGLLREAERFCQSSAIPVVRRAPKGQHGDEHHRSASAEDNDGPHPRGR